MGFRVSGLGSRVWGLGFRALGLGFRAQSSGFRIEGLGCRVWGWGYGVEGLWIWVSGLTHASKVRPSSHPPRSRSANSHSSSVASSTTDAPPTCPRAALVLEAHTLVCHSSKGSRTVIGPVPKAMKTTKNGVAARPPAPHARSPHVGPLGGVGSNCFFHCLDLYHKSPDCG